MTSQQPFHDHAAHSRSNNLPMQAKMTSLLFRQSKSIMQVIVRKPDVHCVYRSHKHLGTEQQGFLSFVLVQKCIGEQLQGDLVDT